MLTSGEEYFWKSKYIIGSRLPKVKIYNSKSTFESQNILSEVDFWKSKYIIRNRLSEVKIHYWKSIFGSQDILPESKLN